MTTKTYSPCLGGPAIGQVHHITEIPEDDPLTIRSRTVWSSGDFDHIAQGFASGAAAFIARLGVRDQRVLDVACGTGNLALPAALAGAEVTGLDIAPNLLATARKHAKEAALAIQFDEGNAEMMPYADGSFDTVVSMFGAMFAARPDCTAAELLRVTRPGGRIAMANWTPEGFVGHMLRAHVTRVPPPAGVPSTLLWGKEDVVGERLADARDVRCTRRTIALAYPCSPRGTAELFRDFYGPTVRTFAALDAEGQAAFLDELEALWAGANVATDGTTRVEAEYLEVLAVT
jgi:SAM-dependent methyltransferase